MKLRADLPIILENVSCPYCGCLLTSANISREHVIGRRFIPKGKLERSWNLILNACRTCNNTKAGLEDDISAITLQPSVFGPNPAHDEIAKTEALRKAENSKSRRTNKLVKNSEERMEIVHTPGPGIGIKVSYVTSPQLDDSRTFELAKYQLMAFFYFITFNKDEKRGFFWREGFHPIQMLCRADWGNATLIDFEKEIRSWDFRFCGVAAGAYFKVIVRKHPSTDCWSWALEWNHAVRLFGFFGDRSAGQQIFERLRQSPMHHIQLNENDWVKSRLEISLDGQDDFLFDLDV